MGFWGNVGGETSSSASVNADGDVSLVLGSVDIGGTRASICDAAGREARPQGRPTSTPRSSTRTPWASPATPAAAARPSPAAGPPTTSPCRSARRWSSAPPRSGSVEADKVEYGDDGVIRGPNDAEGKPRSFTFAELAALLPRTGGTIDVSVNVNYATSGPAFAAHIVDVEVDRDTGKVEVLRYTAVQDVGTAIHPAYVEGQIQGAVAQGIGMALTEEYYVGGDSRMINSSFLDYRMPTALDLPMIDVVLVEVPNPGHPYGVRGVGEVPIVPPLAAVQTAVYNALGVRFDALPITPSVVLGQLLKDDA